MSTMSENKILKAAIYCRKNTLDYASIEQQKEITMRIAKEQELEIFDIYTDIGYSGNDFERPALLRMMTDIENGEIDRVIIDTFSRLGRSMIPTTQITDRIYEAGASLIIADDIHYQH